MKIPVMTQNGNTNVDCIKFHPSAWEWSYPPNWEQSLGSCSLSWCSHSAYHLPASLCSHSPKHPPQTHSSRTSWLPGIHTHHLVLTCYSTTKEKFNIKEYYYWEEEENYLWTALKAVWAPFFGFAFPFSFSFFFLFGFIWSKFL